MFKLSVSIYEKYVWNGMFFIKMCACAYTQIDADRHTDTKRCRKL